MSLGELAALFAPGLLDRARQRWPSPCALYAVGLRDPLGGAIFETMRAIGGVPRPLRRLVLVDRSPVVACAAPLADLLGVLQGLADAERRTTLAGGAPVTPDAARLYRALTEIARVGGVAVVLAAAGLREVLPLNQAAPLAGPWFGGAAPVGVA